MFATATDQSNPYTATDVANLQLLFLTRHLSRDISFCCAIAVKDRDR